MYNVLSESCGRPAIVIWVQKPSEIKKKIKILSNLKLKKKIE